MMSLWNQLSSGQMDFVGQEVAYTLQNFILWTGAIVGFTVGYVYQRFLYTFIIIFASGIVAAAIAIPSWPCFKRNPLKWQVRKTKVK